MMIGLSRKGSSKLRRRRSKGSRRDERKRDTADDLKLIKAEMVAAVLARHGIEAGKTEKEIIDDELKGMQNTIRIKLDSFRLEPQSSHETLSRAYADVVRAVDERLDRISMTDADATAELSRLRADYEWLFNTDFKSIAGELQRLSELVSRRGAQVEARVRHDFETKKSSGQQVPWRPVKLPDEFYQRQIQNSYRQESERHEAAKLRASINEARTQAGRTRL